MKQGVPIHCSWKITEIDEDSGVILSIKEKENLITNNGRSLMLESTFGLAGSSVIVALAVGASTTTATVTDTRLTYELIGNATRKTLTNTSGAALTAGDITLETTTIGTVTYYEKLVVQAIYAAGDSNNGNQFGEYALANTVTNPANPTATSGVILNHLIDSSPVQKTASNSVTIQITIRF